MAGQTLPDYARVRCLGSSSFRDAACGTEGLTYEAYSAQMDNPDAPWSCPRCGSPADFDDAYFDEAHPAPAGGE